MDVDVCRSTVLMQDSSGDSITQRIVRYGTLGPKIVYRSDNATNGVGGVGVGVGSANHANRKMKQQQQRRASYLDADAEDGIVSLKPFEFVIVSVCIPMTHYRERNESIHFETDFLSRSLSVCIPAHVQCQTTHTVIEHMHGTAYHHPEAAPVQKISSKNTKRVYHSTVVVATFADEHEIWEHYMELPGGFLTLIDKRD